MLAAGEARNNEVMTPSQKSFCLIETLQVIQARIVYFKQISTGFVSKTCIMEHLAVFLLMFRKGDRAILNTYIVESFQNMNSYFNSLIAPQ